MKLLNYVKIDNTSVTNFDGEKLYVATGDVDENEIISGEKVTFENRPSRANVVAIKGQILFARMQNTKKVLFIDEYKAKNIYSTGFCTLSVSENILGKYIYYYLNSYKFNLLKDKECTGATQKAINNKGIEKIEIKEIPNIEKQKKIIEEFDILKDALINRQEQIKDIDNMIKSVFIKMFGNPIKNDMQWEFKKLGDICDIYRGASPRPIEKYLKGTIPWIKIGDATTGDNIYLNQTKEYVTEEGAQKSRLIKKGGLIFANCGVSLGFARIINFDGCIHDGWLAFENYQKYLNPIFFLKSLNFCTEYFRKIAPDGTQPNLNTNIMNNYIQIIPPIEKQNLYSNICEIFDKQKELLEKEINDIVILIKNKEEQYF